jgi:hypothetical protein
MPTIEADQSSRLGEFEKNDTPRMLLMRHGNVSAAPIETPWQGNTRALQTERRGRGEEVHATQNSAKCLQVAGDRVEDAA